ncbi:hypothetical protein BJ170DRAFT_732726 [Xylariales sp. AK1849]|nr:hypothetical protein BJ170DRAFT_732726 [Xylariales sp. AK1849]
MAALPPGAPPGWVPPAGWVRGMSPYNFGPGVFAIHPSALPAGFARWSAPHPFAMPGAWANDNFKPHLTGSQAQSLFDVAQMIRANRRMSFNDWKTVARERDIVLALNASNVLNFNLTGRREWAYFHGITVIKRTAGPRSAPEGIVLPPRIVTDFATPWNTVSLAGRNLSLLNAPRYRVAIFIHRHKGQTTTANENWTYARPVYSISIWDREAKQPGLRIFRTTGAGSNHNFPVNVNSTPVPTYSAAVPPPAAIANLVTHIVSDGCRQLYNRTYQRDPAVGATFYTVLGWALEARNRIITPGYLFTLPATNFFSISTMSGLEENQIPRWYALLVHLLYDNRNRPGMPAIITGTLVGGMANFRANWQIQENELLRLRVNAARSLVTGPHMLPHPRSNCLV